VICAEETESRSALTRKQLAKQKRIRRIAAGIALSSE
jgi:hypothetical protein